MVSFYDILGLVGVAISLACYAKVQWQRDFVKHIMYSAGNTVSSICMMVSLSHSWNMAAFISNFCWTALSLYGVYRCMKYARKQRQEAEQTAIPVVDAPPELASVPETAP